jgi:hypothetical protein
MSIIRSAEAAVLALLIMIVLCSCNLPSSKRGPAAAGFGDWNIYDSTVQVHSYTKAGLLDSSLEIYYHLRYGQPDLHLNTLITRVYDTEGHLVEERTFDYRQRTNQWELAGRHVMTYDQKGNLITDATIDIKKSKSTLFRFSKMVYNQHRQEILRFEKMRRIEVDSNEKNLDSAVAHMDDVKIPKYDTTLVSSIYDSTGNLVTQTIGSPGATAESVSYTTYVHGMKTACYFVHAATGDTTLIYRYDKDRGLSREIVVYRMAGPMDGADTCWYRGDKEVKSVRYYYRSRSKLMTVWQYDAKGNEIRQMHYR